MPAIAANPFRARLLGSASFGSAFLGAGLALLALALPSGEAAAQQQVGVNSAVNPAASGTPPGGTTRRLVLGQEVVHNERIVTEPAGQTQVLFLDESTMSIGPNSDLLIDEFVYDPNAGTGKLAASATRGVFRFVGGKLSKQDDGVTIKTPVATMGIRGGVFLMELQPDGVTDIIFVYGKELRVVGANGVTRTLTRPGFHVTISGAGGAPSEPAPSPRGAAAALLAQLDGRPNGNGGAPSVPTDGMVAATGVFQTVSNDVASNVVSQGPRPQQSRSLDVAGLNIDLNINNSFLGSAVPDATPGNNTGNTPNPTPSPVPIPSPVPTPSPNPTPTPNPTPVQITYAGRYKSTAGSGSSQGFVNQSSPYNIAYSDGLIANGRFTATLGNSGTFSIPLSTGFRSFGSSGTSSPQGSVAGFSFLNADNTFFYANLTPSGQPNERAFIFGGMPVSDSFYAATTTPRFFSFGIDSDAALASSIPFIRSVSGGNLANASVSPLYLVSPGGMAFGSFNVRNNTGGSAPQFLQSSLAISGTGTGQSSVIVVNTGEFFTSSDDARVSGAATVHGSYRSGSTSFPSRIGATAATVTDGFGNRLYGGSALSGFVLDQNRYDGAGNLTQNNAGEFGYTGQTGSYGFTQPVVATTLPQNVGVSRTQQTLLGNFGGIVEGNITAPYIVTGTTRVNTDPVANRVSAVFDAPNVSGSNGVSTLTLNFGTLNNVTMARQAYVDDNLFAALESPDTPSRINGTALAANGDPTQSSQIFMVTSDVLGANPLLPSGLCDCAYLKWGYWGGEVDSTTSSGSPRFDRAHINTWLAGVPTPAADIATLQAQNFSGTFAGNAIGTVNNNGALYLASGSFNGSYNFGTQSGTVAVTNLDGRSFNGSVSGNGGTYTGAVSGTNLSGGVNGRFFGPAAINTGGAFAVNSTSGTPWAASGIFGGRR